jgi:hypothetical protein
VTGTLYDELILAKRVACCRVAGFRDVREAGGKRASHDNFRLKDVHFYCGV